MCDSLMYVDVHMYVYHRPVNQSTSATNACLVVCFAGSWFSWLCSFLWFSRWPFSRPGTQTSWSTKWSYRIWMLLLTFPQASCPRWICKSCSTSQCTTPIKQHSSTPTAHRCCTITISQLDKLQSLQAR